MENLRDIRVALDVPPGCYATCAPRSVAERQAEAAIANYEANVPPTETPVEIRVGVAIYCRGGKQRLFRGWHCPKHVTSELTAIPVNDTPEL